jgi:hypothetical protein
MAVMNARRIARTPEARIPRGLLNPSVPEIAVSALLACAVILWIVLLYGHPVPSGLTAEVYGNNSHLMTLDLGRDQTVAVGKMTIEVLGRRVRIASSDCSRQICVRQGWIRGPGQSLICAPNKVTVEIPFRDPGKEAVDAVAR